MPVIQKSTDQMCFKSAPSHKVKFGKFLPGMVQTTVEIDWAKTGFAKMYF